jgi:hypothetical protein
MIAGVRNTMNERDYDRSRTIVLRGTGGLFEGESHPVALGETVRVGRSRHCDFSLKKTRAYLLAEDRAPLREAREFRRISRKHVRISFVNESTVEIENLGRNGLRVDGKHVDRLVVDVRERPRRVDLGGGVTFEIRRGE